MLGLLQLNQQHGWMAEWALPQTKQRLMAFVVVGSGMLWSLVVARGWGIGSTQFLLELGIGAALIVAGAWWHQRNK